MILSCSILIKHGMKSKSIKNLDLISARKMGCVIQKKSKIIYQKHKGLKINLPIFMCMLFALQLFYWIVGRYTSKGVVDKQDYFLAKKSVQFFPLMMTFVGVIVGGGVVLGSAEEAYFYGWPVFFYPLGGALGLMALGTGIGRRLAQFPV